MDGICREPRGGMWCLRQRTRQPPCGGITSGVATCSRSWRPPHLGWANFQVLRRTHASLGHDAGIDPKVAADQRGHGIGVAIDVYTKATLSRRGEAAEQLENA